VTSSLYDLSYHMLAKGASCFNVIHHVHFQWRIDAPLEDILKLDETLLLANSCSLCVYAHSLYTYKKMSGSEDVFVHLKTILCCINRTYRFIQHCPLYSLITWICVQDPEHHRICWSNMATSGALMSRK